MADFSALKTAIQANIRTNGNEEITGAILQDILLSMVTTMGDGAINALSEALQTEITNRQNAVSGEATTRAEADSQLSGRINAEAQTRGEADTQLANSITAIITRLNEGYVYAGIAIPSTNPGTPAGKVFYIALQAGIYTNFSSLAVTQGITILKYNGTAWSQDNLLAIDNVPKKNGINMVTSGGVFANIGAFDISEYHKSGSTLATYADLTAALAALPSDYQKGGMSIKFVQSSDNKYVQYRLMNQNWSTIETDWHEIQDSLTRKKTNILIGGQTLNLNIEDYRGEKISVKVTGDFTQFGYFKSDSSYEVLGYTANVWLTFDVPQDATDFFVYNSPQKGTTIPTIEIRTNLASEVVENTKDIAANTQNIATTKDLLGILWSNLFEGSDMEKGYNQNNILAFSTYPNIGGTVEKVLDEENSRYCIKAHFPAGTEFTSTYVYPSLMKNISFIGEDTTQEFSVSFRYKCSPNFLLFCPLCNGTFMEYLRSDGTWRTMDVSTIPLIRDNNWHYAHIITRKTDVANKTYSVGLYAYFAAGSTVTLEEDLDFCITDIVISPSRFPDYAIVRNVNDYLSPKDKETLQPTVNEIIKEYPDAYGCVFMSLGDSITTESYYIPKLRQILQPSKYYNLAVASATWADRSNTTSYDGNPQFQGDPSQNVLGNQVQKIINNPEIYNVAPDIIIISAGTNDNTPSSQEMEWSTIETYFTQNGGTEPVPCTTPTFDDSDTFKEMRKTITGAMRYVCSKLQEMYPKARIYILTPIQGSFNPNKNYNTQIRLKQQHIANVAKHLTLPVIHVGENCGINQDFEYSGSYWKPEWATEQAPKNGRDLIDGLHPNTSGSWKMAKYIARELFNNYVNQNL